MEVLALADPAEFLERAGPLLLADEPRHNLLFGITSTVRDAPGYYPDATFWVVADGARVVAAALRTPPHNLVIARPARPEALRRLAEELEDEPPGITGALPEARDLAEVWVAVRGGSSEVAMAQRIHALTEVREIDDAPGRMRPPTGRDRDLAIDWFRAFAVEAVGEADPDPADVERAVDHRLRDVDAGLALWEDEGEAVSLAGWGGPTPSGIRIGPVYTPPARRGRGYATALVAALSRELLAAGRKTCFLYTDLANPTANRIYARIGYEAVCDSVQIALSRA